MNTTRRMMLSVAILIGGLSMGCSGTPEEERDFFTSGSRQADQRAQQRVAKDEQLQGEQGNEQAAKGKQDSLYDRLGGEEGIRKIVDDFVVRALADPRVNWERQGITEGGFSIHRRRPVTWDASAENVNRLKTHLTQFLSLATGGPAQYQGQDMKQVHGGLHITNAEFDASVGDLKATLDNLQVPTEEQKELLAIIESTRPQVVEER